jgi:hypothetical protein
VVPELSTALLEPVRVVGPEREVPVVLDVAPWGPAGEPVGLAAGSLGVRGVGLWPDAVPDAVAGVLPSPAMGCPASPAAASVMSRGAVGAVDESVAVAWGRPGVPLDAVAARWTVASGCPGATGRF